MKEIGSVCLLICLFVPLFLSPNIWNFGAYHLYRFKRNGKRYLDRYSPCMALTTDFKKRVPKEGRGNKSPISQHHFHFAEILVIFPIFWVLVFSPRDPKLNLPVLISQWRKLANPRNVRGFHNNKTGDAIIIKWPTSRVDGILLC